MSIAINCTFADNKSFYFLLKKSLKKSYSLKFPSI